MKQLIVRIIKLLYRLKVIKKVIKIVYTGKGVTLNDFYAQKHWSARYALKTKYNAIFQQLFIDSKDLTWMDEYSLVIFYNCRMDLDNVVGTEKLFLDSLKQKKDRHTGEIVREGYVYDDSQAYYKSLVVLPDKTLPKNTFEFYLLQHK
jgi:hypothetical protein